METESEINIVQINSDICMYIDIKICKHISSSLLLCMKIYRYIVQIPDFEYTQKEHGPRTPKLSASHVGWIIIVQISFQDLSRL